MGRKISLAVIEGDGIGPEIVKEALKVLEKTGEKHSISFEFVPAPAGGNAYKKTGEALPRDSLEACRRSDAILKGPVGLPDVTPGIVERPVILGLRQEFDMYANLRPVKLYPALKEVCPLKNRIAEKGIDYIVVRENSEGLYSKQGGISRNVATDINIYSRKGVERIIRYAFEVAKKLGKKKITSVDKANVLSASLFWRQIFEEISKEYEGFQTESILVDAMTQYMIRCPHYYEVIVTDNMFGDILTDESSETVGSLGMGAGANVNPDGISMFEPIHGSAPDIAGKGIANPIGTILSLELMLELFGEKEAAKGISRAVEETLNAGIRTRDIALPNEKPVSTSQMGEEIAKRI